MRICLSLSFVFLLLTQSFSLPKLDPQLKELLDQGSDKEITLILSFPVPEPGKIQVQSNMGIQARKMEEARIAQASFLNESSKFLLSDDEAPKSLWINNSLVFKTTVQNARGLSLREDIESIMLDKTLYLDEPVESPQTEIDEEAAFTYGLLKLRIPEIRKRYKLTGKGIIVGLLDSGWAAHPDLGDRVRRSRDFVSDKAEDQPNDGHGHGTHCLGTIGGGNTSGKSIGVAPEVDFVVGKIYRDDASTELSRQLEAMQWIADPDSDPETPDHPRVISNSWGWKLKQLPDPQAYERAVQTWRELGIVPVFSAGNSGPFKKSIGYPGGLPESIGVGATDSDDSIASFSSRGPMLWDGDKLSKPDVSAPGVSVYSADYAGGYTQMSGTSMAAPHVAGVVALMLQAYPTLGVRGVEQILKDTAVDLGKEGFDHSYGHGRVDAFAAVEKVLNSGQLVLSDELDSGPSTSISIQPGNHSYSFESGATLKIALDPGEYKVTLTRFGFKDIKQTVKIRKLEDTEVPLELEPLPQSELKIRVLGENGENLDAWIIIHDAPFDVLTTQNGALDQSLPHGNYRVSAVRRGYASSSFEVDHSNESQHEIQLEPTASTLVVNDDPAQAYGEYYTNALETLGTDHLFKLSTAIDLAELLAYKNVIWFTGDAEEDTLSKSDQSNLETYLSMGGKLLLTGHGIGNDIKFTRFFNHILGAQYKSQRRLFRNLWFKDTKFKLNGKDSANNQGTPDVIDAVVETAKVILRYTFMGAGGILNTFESGKVLYLGFGWEGIRGADIRSQTLGQFLEMLEPSADEKLNGLSKAYQRDGLLHSILSESFASGNAEEIARLREQISSSPNKRALKKLLFHLQDR